VPESSEDDEWMRETPRNGIAVDPLVGRPAIAGQLKLHLPRLTRVRNTEVMEVSDLTSPRFLTVLTALAITLYFLSRRTRQAAKGRPLPGPPGLEPYPFK
jgi:hypothetical protein